MEEITETTEEELNSVKEEISSEEMVEKPTDESADSVGTETTQVQSTTGSTATPSSKQDGTDTTDEILDSNDEKKGKGTTSTGTEGEKVGTDSDQELADEADGDKATVEDEDTNTEQESDSKIGKEVEESVRKTLKTEKKEIKPRIKKKLIR